MVQFSDKFDRAELGPDWKILNGKWAIEKGTLSGGGGTIMCTKKFAAA